MLLSLFAQADLFVVASSIMLVTACLFVCSCISKLVHVLFRFFVSVSRECLLGGLFLNALLFPPFLFNLVLFLSVPLPLSPSPPPPSLSLSLSLLLSPTWPEHLHFHFSWPLLMQRLDRTNMTAAVRGAISQWLVETKVGIF